MTGKTLVFDLDGTLVSTAADLLDSLNFTVATVGLTPLSLDGFGPILGRGAREMIRVAHEKQQRALPQETLERLFQTFLAHYAANMPGRSELFPGALATLDRFEAAGYKLAICTNKTEALAKLLMQGLNLAPRFAAICGADTFSRSKPDPLHIIETVKLAGGDPAQSVMVGDSRTDIDAAKAAGIPVVAVDFGYTDRHVSEFEPSKVISSYDELTVDLAERLIAAAHDARR